MNRFYKMMLAVGLSMTPALVQPLPMTYAATGDIVGEVEYATGRYSSGYSNTAKGTYATVTGGENNTAQGNYSTVSGGYSHDAYGGSSGIYGGYHNITGSNNDNNSGLYATILGGYENTATGNASTAVGGYKGSAAGQYSTAIGGGSAQGSYSIAIGRNSVATNEGQISFGNGTKNNKLTNIEDGSDDHDAVSVGQMNTALNTKANASDVYTKKETDENVAAVANYAVGVNERVDNVESRVGNAERRISNLEGRVDKVGANAAAMANLHPMEFDEDTKISVAGAIGNYGSATAAAVGVFYRPTERVMFNVSSSFGNGETMIGGGVSFALGRSSKSDEKKLSNAERTNLQQQVNTLKAQNDAQAKKVDELQAKLDALLSVLDPETVQKAQAAAKS